MSWDAIIESNDSRWNEILRRFPKHDFYHLPGYVALEAERRGAKACAYVFSDDQGAFMVPFMESPIPLTLQPRGGSPLDALAPYGYGGPLVSMEGTEAQKNDFVAKALECLVDHLRCRGVCSILLRLHPLLELPLRPFEECGKLVLHGETVCMDLRQTPEAMLADMRHYFRNPIRRLEREGFHFEMDFEGRHMQEFAQLYHETMVRVHAEPHYFFSEEYFSGFRKTLGERFLLAHVRSPAGDIVSSGIFTVCSGITQYHLSGNSLGEKGSGASKLLLYGVAKWAAEQGQEKFNLGGGVGAKNDSLFLFKSGFSSGRALFHTWRLIVNEPVYLGLADQWEQNNRSVADSIEGFFPAYRKLLAPADIRRCA